MPTATTPALARDLRQRELIPPDKLSNSHALVIGVGAIGRQVTLQLAAVGVPSITLYDHDSVGVENLAPQGFWESDVGRLKVEAVAELALRQFPALQIATHASRFRASDVRAWRKDRALALFACVDAIDTRRLIWQAVQAKVGVFIDGRMSAEVIRVLASDRPSTDADYPQTLFAPGEALAGSCTSKSTIYTANIAAGMMVSQFARWLRGIAVIPDQLLNLTATEYHVTDREIPCSRPATRNSAAI